jgi:hypothetical protein
MTFGIGLGGFVSGLDAGVRLGLGIKEVNRTRQTRNQMRQVAEDAAKKYGDVMSDDAYNYMMKRQYAIHMQNGNVEKANQIRDWSQKDSSRKGTKLFGSIGAALNAGDYEAAARLANDLSDLDGYGPNGDYSFEYTEHPSEGPGFYVKSESGEAFVPQDNALPFFTRHFNPEAAATWHAEQSKSKKDLEKEAQSLRSETIKSLEKQYDGGLSGDELKFKDMPVEERERLINEYAMQRIAPGRRDKFRAYFGGDQTSGGGKERTAPGLIVDQNTGQKVKTPRARDESDARPGADGSIVRNDLPPLEASVTGVSGPTEGPGSTTAPLARNREVISAVQAAEDVMAKSGDASLALKTLKDANVPEGYWPKSVRKAMKKRQPTGLGAAPTPSPHAPSAPVKRKRIEDEEELPPA